MGPIGRPAARAKDADPLAPHLARFLSDGDEAAMARHHAALLESLPSALSLARESTASLRCVEKTWRPMRTAR